MADQFFEMLWDCETCGARELLGTVHRHCPMCGAAQDPQRRYFPKPGQEQEAKGHRFVGVDWVCAYCESPNSAAAAFCVNCGGARDGTKVANLMQDKTASLMPASPVLPVAAAAPSGFPWGKAVLALLLVVCSVLAWLFLSKHDESVQIAEKSWSRSIDVERFSAVRSADWCDQMPPDAYMVSRSREQRSTRQVEDGQDCVEVRADRGDGTFSKSNQCSPRYRSEPVFDLKCSFRVNRWQLARTDKLVGTASLTPAWPAPVLGNTLLGGNSLGAERLGTRRESYRVRLQSAQGKEWTCDVDAAIWSGLAEKQPMTLKIRNTGGADCASLAASR